MIPNSAAWLQTAPTRLSPPPRAIPLRCAPPAPAGVPAPEEFTVVDTSASAADARSGGLRRARPVGLTRLPRGPGGEALTFLVAAVGARPAEQLEHGHERDRDED